MDLPFGLSVFRLLVLVVGAALLFMTWMAKLRGRASLGDAIRWSIAWSAICVVALKPKITNEIAKGLGLDSGRFLVLYVAVFFLAFSVVLLYARSLRLSREITLLVREVAIQREDENKALQEKNK